MIPFGPQNPGKAQELKVPHTFQDEAENRKMGSKSTKEAVRSQPLFPSPHKQASPILRETGACSLQKINARGGSGWGHRGTAWDEGQIRAGMRIPGGSLAHLVPRTVTNGLCPHPLL